MRLRLWTPSLLCWQPALMNNLRRALLHWRVKPTTCGAHASRNDLFNPFTPKSRLLVLAYCKTLANAVSARLYFAHALIQHSTGAVDTYLYPHSRPAQCCTAELTVQVLEPHRWSVAAW